MPGLTHVPVEGLSLDVKITPGPRIQLCVGQAWYAERAPLLDLAPAEAQTLVNLLQWALARCGTQEG